MIQEHNPEWLCHKGKSNPRGRGPSVGLRASKPLPYKRVGVESVRGEGGSREISPVMRRALRLKER